MRLNGVQRLLETGLLICTALAIFIFCALISFHPADPSWSQTGDFIKVKNITGTAGAWLADVLLFSFGWLAFLIPIAIALFGYFIFKRPHHVLKLDYITLALRVVGLVLFTLAACTISAINFDDVFRFSSGGIVGDVLAARLLPAFSFTGTSILLLCFLFAGFTLLTGISWVQFVDSLGNLVVSTLQRIWQWLQAKKEQKQSEQTQLVPPQKQSEATSPLPELPPIESEAASQPVEKPIIQPVAQPQGEAVANTLFSHQNNDKLEPQLGGNFDEIDDFLDQEIAFSALDENDEMSEFTHEEAVVAPAAPVVTTPSNSPANNPAVTSYTPPPSAKEQFEALLEEKPPLAPLPSLDLLDRPDKAKNPISEEELEAVSRLVESKLLDFGVQAAVVGVYPGPVVTRFELDLAPGVKVAKITSLAKDLARSMSAISVRVVEVIPGKTYVGLELPNKHREIVRLSEVINAPKFEQNPSPLTMVLGKDIAGQPVVADLAKMPHLLVAGTTGSGKSVGVNVMILSLLYKSPPEDVRMIMIDPKMLELSVYEGIPHLLCEVVTDMKEAANALRWCVGEMERRYKLMSALGVRNLKGYNQKVTDAKAAGQPIVDPLFKDTDGMAEQPSELDKLPSIVVVIDEFADMMMIVGKKVEELIARIAQKARAAGIHLILATQRPSVDVITGLIKANIPTRMAFQVSSKIDSRTILDQQGAEQLLGMGDMLYLPPGTSVSVRVHGAFVDDHEVHAVVNDWKARGKPNYVDEILSGDATEDILLPGESAQSDDAESDPLYDEAVAFVIESGRVSVSSVQRKLRVGYNRAARLVEQMENAGIISPAGHNGSREVLVKNHAN